MYWALYLFLAFAALATLRHHQERPSQGLGAVRNSGLLDAPLVECFEPGRADHEVKADRVLIVLFHLQNLLCAEFWPRGPTSNRRHLSILCKLSFCNKVGKNFVLPPITLIAIELTVRPLRNVSGGQGFAIPCGAAYNDTRS